MIEEHVGLHIYNLFSPYTDGYSVSAAPGSAVSHLWYRVSDVKDPKTTESKICAQYKWITCLPVLQKRYIVYDNITVHCDTHNKYRKEFVLSFACVPYLCLSVYQYAF